MAKVVCLLSGGLDSCVTVAIAHSRRLELAFLHVSYGQLTQDRERRAFHDIADHYSVTQRWVAKIDHLKQVGGSALTDISIGVPEGQIDREGIPVTYIPFRNANLLSMATSWAEILGASFIYVGAVEEDSSGYPDCRHSFFQAFETVIREGTRPGTSIEIVTPVIHLRKKGIVQRGVELKAPLALTWSCYREEEIACGRCDSCLLRLRGFQQAGLPDPLPYKEVPTGC